MTRYNTGNHVAMPQDVEIHQCYYCGKHESEHYINYDEDMNRYYCQDCELEHIEQKKDY
jgi:hypothetical protein